MSSNFESVSSIQVTLDDIMQPSSTSIRVTPRPRSQTLPANSNPLAFFTGNSPTSIASSPVNDNGDIKSDQVLRGKDLLHFFIDNFGLEPVRKLLSGLFRLGKHGQDHLNTIKEINSEHEFGLFQWLPMEVKLKILAYAFEDPRIVSVSCKILKHKPLCQGHARLIYSGPQNPHLYVNRLTRFQSLRQLHNLVQYNPCTMYTGVSDFPTIKYNPTSDTIWIRESDFWSSSNRYSCSFALPGRNPNRAVRSLAITTSSNWVVMDRDNLYRLACNLSLWFNGLQELIVIVDDFDFTTPGVRDEITFVSCKSRLLPKRRVVTKYSPAFFSLTTEFIVGVFYGEWKPDHWQTLASSLTYSLKSLLTKKKEAEPSVPIPIEKVSAAKLYSGLSYWKSRIEILNDNGSEKRRRMIDDFRLWKIPTIKLLAAATHKQLEGKNDN
ncbi:hypothetical protein NHQ30_003611 [Ciborinia camelliae]|nr:hypothetical protein NHQ30_003611 [Ciborinia camelliae]